MEGFGYLFDWNENEEMIDVPISMQQAQQNEPASSNDDDDNNNNNNDPQSETSSASPPPPPPPPPPSPPHPFRLLDLPAEIRNRIYEFLIRSPHELSSMGDLASVMRLPTITVVNKQMRLETLEMACHCLANSGVLALRDGRLVFSCHVFQS